METVDALAVASSLWFELCQSRGLTTWHGVPGLFNALGSFVCVCNPAALGQLPSAETIKEDRPPFLRRLQEFVCCRSERTQLDCVRVVVYTAVTCIFCSRKLVR